MPTHAFSQPDAERPMADGVSGVEKFSEVWDPREGRIDTYPVRTGSEAAASGRRPARRAPWRAVTARLAGPGGFYNIGNLLGLFVGLGMAVAGAVAEPGAGLGGIWVAVGDYFAGSPGAIALTLAMIVFLGGGEVYHRAWAHGSPPDTRLNRLGDFVSGIGAILLTVAMVFVGEPLLALASGTLLAGGKFGSALARPKVGRAAQAANRPDPCRWAVLISRVPALLSVLVQLGAVLSGLGAGTTAIQLVAPATLVVCTLLWAWADVLLFRSAA